MTSLLNFDIALGFVVGFVVGAFVAWWRAEGRRMRAKALGAFPADSQ